MKKLFTALIFSSLCFVAKSQDYTVLLESTPVICKGADNGSIELTIVGPGASFSYDWAGPNGFTSTNKDLSNLEAGTYQVTVTRTSDGSQHSTGINVNEADQPFELSLDTPNTQSALCHGENSGTIKVQTSGGQPPFLFAIRDSDGTTPDEPDFALFESNDGLFEDLYAGTYDIGAIDDYGCFQHIETIEISEPAALTITGIESTNIKCKNNDNGSIKILVTGGTPNYTYSINGNAPGSFGSDSLFENLTPGPYDIWIKDAAGCLLDGGIVEITQPATIFGLSTVQATDAACNGENSGSATLVYTDNTDPSHPIASISWFDSSDVLIAENKETITGLGPGSYYVVVTDGYGCSKNQTFEISEPTSGLNISLVPQGTSNLLCNGDGTGKIKVEASGGGSVYLFSIMYHSGTPDETDFTQFTPNDGLFEGLYAGSYDVAVKDDNGCIRFIENITLTEPDPIDVVYTRTYTSCDNLTDGYINVTSITGGIGPYETEWTNEEGMVISTNQSVFNLPEGNYVLTVTDTKACQSNHSVTIEAGFTMELATTDVTCKDQKNGGTTLIIGLDNERTQEPLQILWKDNQSQTINEYEDSLSIENLAPGTYTVEVTDAFGCTKTDTFAIEEPLNFLSVDSITTKDVICKDGNSGSMTFHTSGGTPEYSYSLDGGVSYSPFTTISGLSAGPYDVWAMDRNGCTLDAGSVTINEPATRYAIDHIDVTDVTCFQKANGEASISFTPDTDSNHPINLIEWFDNADSLIKTGANTIENLTGGTYSVRMEDDNGCVRSASFGVFEPLDINLIPQIDEIPCWNTGTGLISITPSGGNGGYSYNWFKGTTPQLSDSDTLEVAGPGQYLIKVTDSKGCFKTQEFDMQTPDSIRVTSDQVNVVCKDGATGIIELNVTGGTVPYRYTWEKDGTFYQNTQNLQNLEAASYGLTILDNNDCQQTLTVEITEPSTSFEISDSTQSVTCSGYGDGAITVTINADPGHPSGYAYSWLKDGSPFIDNTKNLTGLDQGEYTLLVTDFFGCTKSNSSTVDEKVSINLNSQKVDNKCSGQHTASITIDPSGGTGSYTIEWYNGSALMSGETGNTISNLTAGLYKVNLLDDFGCKVSDEFEITTPQPIAVTELIENIKCNGESTGQVTLDISGGTTPYDIIWTKNGSFVSSGSSEISQLDTGNYQVTIQDFNNCPTYTDTYTVTMPTTGFELGGTFENISCHDLFDGSISIAINDDPGHSASYGILWTKDGNDFMTGASDLENLGAGVYSVSATDQYGCLKSLDVELTNPGPIYFRPEIIDITCVDASNGKILLDPVGGYGSFSIIWTDNSGNQIATGVQALGLIQGAYTATLTDAGGCESDTVINLSDPKVIELKETITPVSCLDGNDGSIQLDIANGTSPYFTTWTKNSALIATDQNIQNLESGTYQVRVLDANQCESIQSFIVGQPATTFNLTGQAVPITCSGGTDGNIDLVFDAPGHPDNYSIVWEKDNNFFAQNTEDLIGLGTGVYTTTVRDAYGCTKTTSFTLDDPDPILVTDATNNLSCFQSDDGSISLSITGGYGGYEFSWEKNGTLLNNQSSYINHLEGGVYTIEITDLNGCIKQQSFEVTQPDEIVVDHSYSDNSCFESRDSKIDISVTGGTQPYHYEWKKNNILYNTSQNLTALEEGTYKLTVSDANQCQSKETEVSIQTPGPLKLDITKLVQPKCSDTENGEIAFEAEGGVGNYQYLFNNEPKDSNHQTLLLAGTYPIGVVDNNGCRYDTSVTINPVYKIEANFYMTSEHLYMDFPISFVDQSTGDNIVSWFWDFGDERSSSDKNPTVAYESEGSYSINLLVENVHGCKSSVSKELEIIRGFNFVVPEAFTPNGDGLNDYFKPSFENIIALKMVIMDRSHRIVFQSNELSTSWDGVFEGRLLPDGPYYYEMVYTPESGISRNANGKVLIMR